MSKSIEAIREASFDAEFLEYIAESLATYDSFKPLDAHETAEAIRNCIKAHDAALSRASEVEAQTIERCAAEVERVGPSEGPTKLISDGFAAAIRSMRPTGDSGVQS